MSMYRPVTADMAAGKPNIPDPAISVGAPRRRGAVPARRARRICPIWPEFGAPTGGPRHHACAKRVRQLTPRISFPAGQRGVSTRAESLDPRSSPTSDGLFVETPRCPVWKEIRGVSCRTRFAQPPRASSSGSPRRIARPNPAFRAPPAPSSRFRQTLAVRNLCDYRSVSRDQFRRPRRSARGARNAGFRPFWRNLARPTGWHPACQNGSDS